MKAGGLTSYARCERSFRLIPSTSTSFLHGIARLSLTVSYHPSSFSCSTRASKGASKSSGKAGAAVRARFFNGGVEAGMLVG